MILKIHFYTWSVLECIIFKYQFYQNSHVRKRKYVRFYFISHRDVPKVTEDQNEEGDDKKYKYLLYHSRHLPKFKFTDTKKKEHVVVKGAEDEKSEDESDSSESIDGI